MNLASEAGLMKRSKHPANRLHYRPQKIESTIYDNISSPRKEKKPPNTLILRGEAILAGPNAKLAAARQARKARRKAS